MLEHIWHWRFAKKLSPALQENRLLYVANGGGNNTDPEEENVEGAEGAEENAEENAEANQEVTPEQEEQPVEGVAEGTQAEVANTMDTPESVNSRAQSALERLRDVMNRFENYKDKPQVKEVISDISSLNRRHEFKLAAVTQLLEKQQQWERGSLAPADYRDAVQRFVRDVNGNEIEGGTEIEIELAPEHDIGINEWMSMPRDERRRIQEEINQGFADQDFGNATADALEHVEAIEGYLTDTEGELEAFIEDLQSEQESSDQDDNKAGIISNARAALGSIRLISIMDVIRAGNKYYEGLKSAWDKRAERVSAGLATGIGSALRFMPLGNEVYTELATARESKNEEEKNQHKELMKQNNTTFPAAASSLAGLRLNANKFNGAMEYMAERGWLYDLNIGARTLFGVRIPVPDGWSPESYKENLIRMQSEDSSGQESQKKRMENLIGTKADIEPIAQFIKDELKAYNYWAVYTALEIAMRKGKIGESGTWISTIFLSHLRNNPEARKFVPIDILDQLGNIGIEHPAWTPTFFKIDRSKLEAWQKGDDPDQFEYAGDLAKAITVIEKDIAGKFGSTDAEIAAKFGPKVLTLDQLVAQVLAAQVVTHGDQTVSIFDSRYSTYRRSILEKNTSIDAGKADDDFYGNISDAHLIGVDGVRSIFAMNTQGGFNHLQKANYYIQMIIELDDQLQKSGTEEAKRNFRAEMQEKLDQYFEEDVRRHKPTRDGWLDRKVKGSVKVVEQFRNRDMLSADIYDKTFVHYDDVDHVTGPGATGSDTASGIADTLAI
ncbi:MAG: hypothetical protein HOG89_00105 [Candidatus Peribacter sp.]|jgi:hypothetical protein|nr:hypothetical protein [Candidatus Peribacter sp.]MBT5937189.1 hypothetical protein [Candidatus Peribacter sp.]